MPESEAAAQTARLAEVAKNPKYQTLIARRTRFGWILTVIMLIAYFGYVGLIAFDKDFLGQPIGLGVISLGIPVGFALILFTIIITAVYVFRANNEFDRLTEEILKEAEK